jgi:DNA invertase Pin-like site-specific DNA recombinase
MMEKPLTKRAALYLRVSTDQQTTMNQRLVLEEVAQRHGWRIVSIFADEGISGAKGRDQRPAFDELHKAISRREIDIIMVWSVDRLGRSLPDLVGFLSEVQSKGCDLYLHQQALDTSTPTGRMMFQMLSVFAEFERSMIRSRVKAGLERTKAKGTKLGRPSLAPIEIKQIRQSLDKGLSIRKAAKKHGVSTATIMRVKQESHTTMMAAD